MPTDRHLMPRLTALVLTAVVLAAGVGLLAPDVYRDPASGSGIFSRSFWRGSDLVTLLLVVPASVVAYRRAAGGSWRGWLVWSGTMHFFVYNYAFYLFAGVLNWLFPLYLAIVGLAAAVLVRAVARGCLPMVRFPAGRRYPAWIGGYLTLFGAVLVATWTNKWITSVASGTSGDAEGEFVRTVAAIDLLVLGIGLLIGVAALWRHRRYGRALAAVMSVSAGAEMLVLAAAAVMNARAGVDGAGGEVPIWAVLSVGCLVAALASLRPPGEARG